MRNALPLFVLILVALVLRAGYVQQPMRYDESLTFLNYASQPLTTALSSYNEPNNHLFHTLLVHITSRLFGDAPWVIRLPAFIAGILIIPAVFWTAQQFFGRRTALLSAALTAVSLALIEFSVNARGYTLITLFFVLLLGLAKLVQTHDRWWLWLGYAMVAALGFYTIPVFVYPMGIVSLWLLLSLFSLQGDKRWIMLFKFALSLLLGAALTLLFYSPVIQNEGISALTGNQFVTQLPANVFYQSIGQLWEQLWGFINRGFDPGVQVILAAGVLVSFLFRKRIQQDHLSVLLTAALWLSVVLLFQRVIPFDRTWIFLIPLYFMLAAAGIAFLIRDNTWFFLVSIGLVGLVGASVLSSDTILTSELTGYAPDAEAIALYTIDQLNPADRLYIPVPLDEPVRYYLQFHGNTSNPVFNQYQVGWVDLMENYGKNLYVVGIPTDDRDAFQTAFELGEAPYRYGLTPIATFPVQVMLQIVAPTFVAGVLFSDDFDGDFSPGWQFNGGTPSISFQRGEQVMVLDTDIWTELTIDGGSQWRDYTLDLDVEFTRVNDQFDDLSIHVRNDFGVRSAAATFNVDGEQVGIGGDAGGAWNGYVMQESYPLKRSRRYALQVRVFAETLEVRIDGTLVLQTSNISAVRGTFRIVLPPDVRLTIDNLIIRQV